MRNINHHSKFDNMMRFHSKLYNICLYIFICLIIVNLDIVTANAQTVVRGPYLQNGATDGVSIMWRTDTSTVGRVWYGSSLDTLHQIVDETSGEGTDHLVRLEFLTPNTKYFYQIGTDQGTVLTGGDTEHYFYTNPYIQVAQPVRIWAIGDSGTANTNAQMVRDAYIELATTEKKADLWLMLGDEKGMEMVTAGKLFEYFGTRKPIIGCLPEGASKMAVKNYGASFITKPKDIKAIKKIFVDAYNLFQRNALPTPDEEFIIKHDRKYLTHRLIKNFQFHLKEIS